MLKLIIWDLDDTLWRGTLADGDQIEPLEHRIELVRAFNARGVVSSICSKNDCGKAEARLRELGWWEEFVFPRIAFAPKPAGVAGIIADMQLRPCDVLFVDDNPQNLESVRFHLPDIQLLDINQAGSDAVLHRLLGEQQEGKSRVAAYRSLETRKRDRSDQAELSHEDFLRSCEIRVAAPFCMENLDYVDRIAELMRRSNQLNYTNSRCTAEALRAEIIDVLWHPSLAIFAWDRYGDYGLVGFVMLKLEAAGFRLVHCVFSCRVMHMGLEQAAFGYLRERARDLYPPILTIDMGDIEERIDEGPVDWVTVENYGDAAVRAQVAAEVNASANKDADIRIMCSCQSGGVAHFSERRDQIIFDSYPDAFMLRMFWDGSYEDFPLLQNLVYGAGTDYADILWRDLSASLELGGALDILRTPTEDLTPLLDEGRYEICVRRFCEYVVEQGTQLLVILPPELLPMHKYRPEWGITQDRTARFNAIWRRAFQIYSGVSIIDSDHAHAAEDLIDVNHHSPAALRTLATLVDAWYDQVRPVEAEPEDRLAA